MLKKTAGLSLRPRLLIWSTIKQRTFNSCIRKNENQTNSKWICNTVFNRCQSSYQSVSEELQSEYDAVIVGAGHNGLVAAAYLQKAGHNVCVLERRHVIGGAAVTEEIVPGFKFSRASYVLSLLRPQIVKDLELKKYGLKVYLRNPNSYTPLIEPMGRTGQATSLLLSRDKEENIKQISQFSEKDAKAFYEYEESLDRIVAAIDPLLDNTPVKVDSWVSRSWLEKKKNWPAFKALLNTGKKLGPDLTDFYELLTAPATKVLDRWFESEPLKATLATDSVIGAMISPQTPGSGYVLLHHVMGELEGIKGAWGYVEGGMGAVSHAISRAAIAHGAHVFTDKPVSHIDINSSGQVQGVVLKDGQEVKAKIVLSNATAKVTFLDLVPTANLDPDFIKEVSLIDYTSPVTKINVAVDKLPNFTANPNENGNKPGPQHMGTIHINCEHSDLIHAAYLDAQMGVPSKKPVIEMTIPSSLDPTVAPPGGHVVQLFTQYTPYHLPGGKEWDQEEREKYAHSVFDDIEAYAPGFKASIVGTDILTPPDLEQIFGLTGGNIFHGAMSLDQLYMQRPLPAYCDHRSPIDGLYMCGSGTHPGGGVMGAPGRLAAMAVLQDARK